MIDLGISLFRSIAGYISGLTLSIETGNELISESGDEIITE